MIGIIVLNYNTPDETHDCITSIRENTKSVYKIYLVDNKSSDECRNDLVTHYSNSDDVKLIFSERNLGYSGGNNLGTVEAIKDGADRLLIVNSDVIFNNDVATILASCIKNDVAIAGPQVRRSDETNGQLMMHTYSFKYAVADRQPFAWLASHFNINDAYINAGNKDLIFDGMVSGCCFIADAVITVGGKLFDDNTFLYSEERIMGLRLKKRNLKVEYCPEAKIHHLEGKSTGGSNPFADYHRYASDYYCLARYGDLTILQKRIIKCLRLFNFKIKSLKDKSYRDRYKQLKRKYKEIDHGNYKISI